jgi:splicing factor 1
MSWRNPQGVTGSNNIPLGNRRRFPGDSTTPEAQTAPPPPPPHSDIGSKRGRSPVRGMHRMHPYSTKPAPNIAPDLNPDGTKKRKKKNRWGEATENKAAGLMGLPTAIMANMTSEQLEAYTLHLRIEEISQKLKINDVVPADGDR